MRIQVKNKIFLLLEQSTVKDINEALTVNCNFFNILDEAWLYGITSSYFKAHYKNHVLQPNEVWEEFPAQSKDGEYRIKMPPMSEEEYESRADALAAESNVQSYKNTTHPYIGGIAIAHVNGESRESLVKIRRHSDLVISSGHTKDGKARSLNAMSEIVIYIKAPDGSNFIITYMLVRNISRALININWVGELPEEEVKKKERTTYYLCKDNYETTGGERYFETIKFNSYKEANDYFSTSKKTSQLIKVDAANKKVVAEKNTKNVIPEIKNKDNQITTIKEAIYLLDKNKFNI